MFLSISMYISRILVNLCKATTNFELKNINNNKKKRQKVTAGVGIKGCPQLEGIMSFLLILPCLPVLTTPKYQNNHLDLVG